MILNKDQFELLPLGAIQPEGWLKKQLRIQAEGLSGHIDEYWKDLGPDNMWLGGDKEGWERGPYYTDGLVPLAYLLDDKELKEKAQVWVDSFLENQDDNGWIGPKNPEEDRYQQYDPWPIFVVLKALTQYYEATDDDRVIDSMTKFFHYLKNNLAQRPLFSWGKFRWADLVLSIHWLYKRTEEDWLLKLAETVSNQGYDWKDHFQNFPYKEKNKKIDLKTHVVNNAMGIKTSGVWFRQSSNDEDRQTVYRGIEKLDNFHGQVTGVFTGDEHLSGKNPSQGTELCAVVEYMFSLEQLISIFGDSRLADRLERITFNALPATFKPDMWAHQYDQQVNQVICNVAERDWTNGPDANIYGLEPNFGCCTANMHQGWPKFASCLWMQTKDNGLAAIAYSPSKVTATVGNGQEVTIIEETDYPFDNRIKFTVESEKSVIFPLKFRIPDWANGAKVELPGGEIKYLSTGSFYEVERLWHPGDIFLLDLPMKIKTERRYRGAVSVIRGPLVYALKIEEEWKLIGGRMPAGDWEVYPVTPWNYGLIVNTKKPDKSINIEKKIVNNNPFSPEGAPIKLKIKGKYLPDWQLEDNWAGEIPLSPIRSNEKAEELTLIPYGCTNLRITEFPLVEKSNE